MENNLLYQLTIEAELDKEWTGTVWYSRLYPSREACLAGCPDENIMDIGETITRFYPALDEDIYDYAADAPELLEFLDEIRDWFQGDENKHFRDPCEYEDYGNPLHWEIKSYHLSPDNIWVCRNCESQFTLNSIHPEVQSGDYYHLDEHNRIPCPWCAGWMYLAEGAKGGNA